MHTQMTRKASRLHTVPAWEHKDTWQLVNTSVVWCIVYKEESGGSTVALVVPRKSVLMCVLPLQLPAILLSIAWFSQQRIQISSYTPYFSLPYHYVACSAIKPLERFGYYMYHMF